MEGKFREIWKSSQTGDLPQLISLLQEISDQGPHNRTPALLISALNSPNHKHFGWTPLQIAALNGHVHVVHYLIGHPHVDVNRQDRDGRSALWMACARGNEEVVKVMIASGRKIDTELRTITPPPAAAVAGVTTGVEGTEPEAGEMENGVGEGQGQGVKDWMGTTAAEIARKNHRYYDKDWRMVAGAFPALGDLVEEFQRNQREVQIRIRRELGWKSPAGDIFSLGLLLCDGYLEIKEGDHGPTTRFLKILMNLHEDLQMVLINRSLKSTAHLIPSLDRHVSLVDLISTLCPE